MDSFTKLQQQTLSSQHWESLARLLESGVNSRYWHIDEYCNLYTPSGFWHYASRGLDTFASNPHLIDWQVMRAIEHAPVNILLKEKWAQLQKAYEGRKRENHLEIFRLFDAVSLMPPSPERNSWIPFARVDLCSKKVFAAFHEADSCLELARVYRDGTGKEFKPAASEFWFQEYVKYSEDPPFCRLKTLIQTASYAGSSEDPVKRVCEFLGRHRTSLSLEAILRMMTPAVCPFEPDATRLTEKVFEELLFVFLILEVEEQRSMVRLSIEEIFCKMYVSNPELLIVKAMDSFCSKPWLLIELCGEEAVSRTKELCTLLIHELLAYQVEEGTRGNFDKLCAALRGSEFSHFLISTITHCTSSRMPKRAPALFGEIITGTPSSDAFYILLDGCSRLTTEDSKAVKTRLFAMYAEFTSDHDHPYDELLLHAGFVDEEDSRPPLFVGDGERDHRAVLLSLLQYIRPQELFISIKSVLTLALKKQRVPDYFFFLTCAEIIFERKDLAKSIEESFAFQASHITTGGDGVGQDQYTYCTLFLFIYAMKNEALHPRIQDTLRDSEVLEDVNLSMSLCCILPGEESSARRVLLKAKIYALFEPVPEEP
jgi:hypothetical protein